MQSFIDSVERFLVRFAHRVPREHGFWVMLSAVVIAAFVRHPSWAGVVVGPSMMIGAAWVGSEVRSQVRREGRLQLASVSVLAASGLPVELVGGARLVDAVANVLAWVVVACAFTLSVWACTARSSRVRRPEVAVLTLLAFMVPLAAAVGFAFAAFRAPALAAMLAAGSSVVFAIWRPGAKQMKAIGLSLAGAAAFVGLVLAVA